MIKSLAVTNYRKFKNLRIEALGRVNLFVGKNNSGKSSLLEVVELLNAPGIPTLTSILARRGEHPLLDSRESSRSPELYLDVKGIFGQLDEKLCGELLLECKGSLEHKLGLSIAFVDEERRVVAVGPDGEPNERIELWSGLLLELQTEGREDLKQRRRLESDGAARFSPQMRDFSSQHVGTQRSNYRLLSRLWDDVVLKNRESLVYQCLQIVHPSIEKIHFTSQVQEGRGGGVAVLEKGSSVPLAIGSLGDGFKHLLTLSIHLAAAKGVFLVDEIDTGLHFSTLRQVWELILKASEELDIQVFATTHSGDCIRALAQTCEGLVPAYQVFLHRLEGESTVVYSQEELLLCADEEIEVR